MPYGHVNVSAAGQQNLATPTLRPLSMSDIDMDPDSRIAVLAIWPTVRTYHTI